MHKYVNSVISNGDKYVKTKYDVLKRDFRAANFDWVIRKCFSEEASYKLRHK